MIAIPAVAGQPITDRRTFKVSDLNGDGLLDVVAADPDASNVSIYLGLDENTFSDPKTIEISQNGVIVVTDLDGDGFSDIAIASGVDSFIDVHRNQGDGSFELVNRIHTNGVPMLLQPVARQPGQPTLLFACNGPLDTAILIESCIGNSNIIEIQPSFVWDDLSRTLSGMGTSTAPYSDGDVTGDGLVDLTDVNVIIDNLDNEDPPAEAGRWCDDNDFLEPACNPNSESQGVQACMAAVSCRGTLCHWAACIELRSGGTLAWLVSQNLACAAVADLEYAACLTAAIPRVR